jgi:hypothetical protein
LQKSKLPQMPCVSPLAAALARHSFIAGHCLHTRAHAALVALSVENQLSGASAQSGATERAAVLAGGAALSREEHGRRVAALVDSQRRYRNHSGGFWVAATDPQAAHQALTGRAPLPGPGGLHRAALLTDGATRAVDIYGLMSWPALDLMTTNGPTALLDAVRAAEDDDPDGAAFPRMKRSDATAVGWSSDRRD